MTNARRALRRGTCRHLARRATEPLSAITGSTDTEHEQAPATPLESKLLVVHRLLPRRRKTCSRRQRRASCAQSRRPSAEGLGLQSGALDLFGVLAGRDRNGEIFGDATFSPTGSTARTQRNQAAINTASFGASYFDGFVGHIKGQFRPDLVEAIDTASTQLLPATFIRLWKLHGSSNWEWQMTSARRRIVRLGDHAPAGSAVAIYPSDEKYDDSDAFHSLSYGPVPKSPR